MLTDEFVYNVVMVKIKNIIIKLNLNTTFDFNLKFSFKYKIFIKNIIVKVTIYKIINKKETKYVNLEKILFSIRKLLKYQ